jgi:anti-sigma factor RsiW
MKNFEERYTAWLDGTLDQRQRIAFEREIDDLEAARRDREGWRKLGALLRESLGAEAAPHAEFVNARVLEAIGRDAPAPARRPALFPVRWLAYAGAVLVVIAAGLTALLLPGNIGAPPGAESVSQVISTRAADPRFAAYAFQAPGGKGAVLWIEHAGYIPGDQSLK